MLFIQGVVGERRRKHVRAAIEVLIVSAVFSNSFEGIERRGKDVGDAFHQGESYISQVHENFVNYFQTVVKFLVHVKSWVVRSHGGGMSQSLCQRLYCVNMLPLSENKCSGSHKASVIGYPRYLMKY